MHGCCNFGVSCIACLIEDSIGMHTWFGGFGEHGHSHGDGKKCAGHGHEHGHGHGHEQSGHAHGEMSEEMRAAMLKQLEMQMEMMTSGRLVSHGHVLHDPTSPGPASYSALLFGYGHDPAPPPYGWGSLADVPSPMTDAVMPLSLDETRRLMSPSDRNNFWSPRVPVLGRLRIVKDSSGLAQASVVVLYWLYGNWSTWSAILLPYYADGLLPISLLLSKTLLLCCFLVKQIFLVVHPACKSSDMSHELTFWY